MQNVEVSAASDTQWLFPEVFWKRPIVDAGAFPEASVRTVAVSRRPGASFAKLDFGRAFWATKATFNAAGAEGCQSCKLKRHSALKLRPQRVRRSDHRSSRLGDAVALEAVARADHAEHRDDLAG